MNDKGSERTVLTFPNQSRVFDRTRRAVHFWGHDSAMEWSFFVGEDALERIQPEMGRDQAGFLEAFDSNRELIYAAGDGGWANLCIKLPGNAKGFQLGRKSVKRRWIGTPYRHPKGTPLIDEPGR